MRVFAWLVRCGVVLFALQHVSLATPRVTLGPPQTVETQHPVICVHTRLTDEVETWKVQRNWAMVREMGASTAVEFFPWPYIETSPGHYNWTHPDRIIAHAENQGITVLARLGLVPAWARPPVNEKVTTFNYLTEDYYDEFAAFVGAFAERYGDRIGGIQVWNEPNLAHEWGGQPPDPEAYVTLLSMAYEAAKAADPDLLILGGALAPTLEPEGSTNGMNDLAFLARMYEAGAADYFDVLAAHTYGFRHTPEEEPDPEVVNFRRVELLREIMEQYGDGDKPVYITESGWNDNPLWDRGIRPGQRIDYTLTAFQMVEDWPWAEHLCLWIFRQPVDRFNRRDAHYALVTADFRVKPIYEAIQAYAHGQETPYTQ